MTEERAALGAYRQVAIPAVPTDRTARVLWFDRLQLVIAEDLAATGTRLEADGWPADAVRAVLESAGAYIHARVADGAGMGVELWDLTR